MAKTQKFEEQLKRLEEIAAILKQGDLSLEENISLYQESQTLTKALHQTLDAAELTVKSLGENEEADDDTAV